MATRLRRVTRSRAASKRSITPEDLQRFKFLGDPRMSPDGSRVLFGLKTVGPKNNYLNNLWIVSAEGGEPVQFTSGGKDKHGRWSADGSRIAFIRSADDGKSQICLMSSSGGEAVALTSFPEGAISSFKWSPDGKTFAVSFRASDPLWTREAAKKREESGSSTPPRVIDDPWYRLDGDGYFNAQRFALYLVDAQTGKHRLLFDKDTLGGFSCDWSPDSRTLAVSSNTNRNALFRDWNDRIFLIDTRSGKRREVPNLPAGPKANVQWSPDGRLLAYGGRIGPDSEYSTDNLRLFVCDPRAGTTRDLTGETDYCLMAITLSDASEAVFGPTFCWHPDGRRIFMRIGWHGEGRIASISRNGGRLSFHARGEAEHCLGTFSDDGRRLAVLRSTPAALPEVGVAEVGRGSFRLTMRTRLNAPLLSELAIAPIESQWVTAEDGNKVQVWWMRPPRTSRSRARSTRLPAVLQVHGGPHAQYGTTFFHEFQVLAAAGHAVFFSNPRGSKGYGRDFCHAIHGSWGGKDWVDVQAVAAFIRSRQWVASKRVGIMGGSYGGYMTNWAIGHTREFAGAITDRCVSNLLSMWGNSDFPERPDRYWKGNAWSKAEAAWQSSPIKHMGFARTPTLIIHSEGDLRCNIEQAEQVFTILNTHNVPTRFVRYPANTSHGMSRIGPPDLRIHRLHQILAWWKRWLK